MTIPETLKGIPFKYEAGFRGEFNAERIYRNSEYGLRVTIVTPYRNGGWGEAVKFYSADGCSQQYTSYSELREAVLKQSKKAVCNYVTGETAASSNHSRCLRYKKIKGDQQ